MQYLPHTKEDIKSMLEVVGVSSLDELFSSIPENCRFDGRLNLPEPMTEWELDDHMDSLAGNMAVSPDYKIFIGAGSYTHHIPMSVKYVTSRSEFVTCYTPYQPEVSQGTLQAIYEYQTMAATLMGMDVATASHYDGATALAEALLIAARKKKKKYVAISSLIHPHYREVIHTYFSPTQYEIIELPYLENGRTDLSQLESGDEFGALAIQSPNFFGCIENLKNAADIAHDQNALFIGSYTEAMAYGLLKNPGSMGADIVAGEGQSLGIAKSYGGPALGMLGSKKEFMRMLPGRLVGKTTDQDGRPGFVLTLATREQHIRREKATSNICSNNNLCALSAVAYMASLGGTGFRKLAQLNHDKAEYLKSELKKAGGKIPFESPTFNEFVVRFKNGFDKKYARLKDKKILAGLPLATFYPELENHYLMCVTETLKKEDMDMLIQEVIS
ncbi:MAG: aminomethyl-transferring glycine dehydrogenase subunit GcvPA [Desulfobacterales bacterium]|nr:aminomethyl-transferring glycine dehydrogenase subunit GcvPA [Desulfobacterales bacterium]